MRFAETSILFLPKGPLFGLSSFMWLPLVMICAPCGNAFQIERLPATVGFDGGVPHALATVQSHQLCARNFADVYEHVFAIVIVNESETLRGVVKFNGARVFHFAFASLHLTDAGSVQPLVALRDIEFKKSPTAI
jgi:hypothetical protein